MNKEQLAVEEASSTYQLAAENCGLRKGYKQTEVGVIPEDWDVTQLDSLGAGSVPPIKAGPFGSSLTKDTYVPSGYKVYGQEQVIRGDYLYGDYFISPSKFRELESCSVSPGDVLLSLVGTTGKLLVIPEDAPVGVINPRLIRFSFDKKRVCPLFFKNLFEANKIQALLARSAQGGTMGVLNAGMLRPMKIPLPSFPEQRAIVKVLSNVDALLAKLDQLITKKRDLKQATMQQLLTGQTRLPGFSPNSKYQKTEVGFIPEDWDVKRLGDVCEYQNGTSLEHLFNDRQGLQVISIGNYSSTGNFVYRDTYIDHRHKKLVEKFVLKKNDLAMSLNDKTAIGAILGRVLLIREDDNFVFNQRTMRLRPKIDIIPAYLYYVINGDFIHNSLVALAKPGTQIYINTDDVIELKIPVPYAAEQQAIATFLSDMDIEITALETRRDKTRDLKQGMMQELLTGRIRLV